MTPCDCVTSLPTDVRDDILRGLTEDVRVTERSIRIHTLLLLAAAVALVAAFAFDFLGIWYVAGSAVTATLLTVPVLDSLLDERRYLRQRIAKLTAVTTGKCPYAGIVLR